MDQRSIQTESKTKIIYKLNIFFFLLIRWKRKQFFFSIWLLFIYKCKERRQIFCVAQTSLSPSYESNRLTYMPNCFPISKYNTLAPLSLWQWNECNVMRRGGEEVSERKNNYYCKFAFDKNPQTINSNMNWKRSATLCPFELPQAALFQNE